MSTTKAAHRAALEAFGTQLRSSDFEADLDPRTDIPMDTLVVRMVADEGTGVESWQMDFAFLPHMEEEGVSFLQCFAMLPYTVPAAAEQDLTTLLLHINATLPMVGFGYLHEPRVLYYRHVILLPSNSLETSANLVEQAAWMVTYLLDLFGPALLNAISPAQPE